MAFIPLYHLRKTPKLHFKADVVEFNGGGVTILYPHGLLKEEIMSSSDIPANDDITHICKGEEIKELENLDFNTLELLSALACGEITVEVREDKHETTFRLFGEKPLPKNIADRLAERRLIEFRVVDRIIRCPFCDSAKLKVKMVCPHCGSFDIEKVRIIQHIICGYIGLETEFRLFHGTEEATMQCPSCKSVIASENDYRILGTLFVCNECRRRFHEPKIKFVCLSCGKDFTPEKASYKPVLQPVLTEKGKRIVTQGLDLKIAVQRILLSLDIKFVCDAVLEGATGSKYHVSFWLPDSGIVIDIFTTNSRPYEMLVIEHIKIRDLIATGNVSKYIVVARPLTDDVRKLFSARHVLLLDGSRPSKLIKAITEVLKPGMELIP